MNCQRESRKFVSGVVEGFYGRPWTPTQRLELFDRLRSLTMNTYLYAPKDDLKHRQMWRDLYTEPEANQLKYLIDAATQCQVTFVYAISPGLDITFSNSNDVFLLKQKMNQVLELGCHAFSLLFDDIDPNLNETDTKCFESLAAAQVSLTNDLFEFLREPSFFLFCPTEYCGTRASPCVQESTYLSTVGSRLRPGIDIMWTGPKVISKVITVESVLEVSVVLHRPPLIWDNLHANDYDQKRLFLGPYCGRSSRLRSLLRGVLTNPNCEFETNFVAIHTLAQWIRASSSYQVSESNVDPVPEPYVPSRALETALADWLRHLYQKKSSDGDSGPSKSVSEGLLAVAMGSVPPSAASVSVAASQALTTQQLLSLASEDGAQEDCKKTEEVREALDQLGPADSVAALAVATVVAQVVAEEEAQQADMDETNGGFFNFKSPDLILDESGAKITREFNINEVQVDKVVAATPMEIEDEPATSDSMIMQVDPTEDAEGDKMETMDDGQNKEESVPEMKPDTERPVAPVAPPASNISPLQLSLEDLTLLVHLFFLPYEHGPQAVKMLELIHWLRSHAHLVDQRGTPFKQSQQQQPLPALQEPTFSSTGHDLNRPSYKSLDWHLKAKEFVREVERVRSLVDLLCNIPNRAALYDLYPYIQDMRYVLGTLRSYVMWMDDADITYGNVCALRKLLSWCTPGYKESFMSDDHEPWMFRGGLISEFQRMFPLEGSFDLFPNRSSFLQHPPSQLPVSNFDEDPESRVRSSENGSSSCESGTPLPQDPQSPMVAASEDMQPMGTVPRIAAIKPCMYVMRQFYPADRSILYDLCLQLLCQQLGRNPRVDKTELARLYSPQLRNLPGDRYIGHYLEFGPESCMVLGDEGDAVLGYALGTSRIGDFLRFRREQYNPRMRENYSGILGRSITAGGLSSEATVNSVTVNVSVIQMLVDGFLDEEPVLGLSEITEPPNALIHIDLVDCCTETDLDTIDTLSRKLLLCLCSAIKTSTVQASEKMYPALLSPSASQPGGQQEPQPPTQALPDPAADQSGDSSQQQFTPHLQQQNFVVPSLHVKDRFSMAIYCEVDCLNKCYEEFYNRCGFSKCQGRSRESAQIDGRDDTAAVVMLRYV